MISKKFSDAMNKIDDKYIDEAMSYDVSSTPRKKFNARRTMILAAAMIAILSLCSFAAYELGLFDPWLQRPTDNPIATVQSALEGQLKKEYTIHLRIEEITIDEVKTAEIKQQYKGSELAVSRGWSDQYIEEHFIVVRANYYVEYDHTKTFLDDGYTLQYFYLTENIETGEWEISDNTGAFTVDE